MSFTQTTPTADQVGVLHAGAVPIRCAYYGGNPATSGAVTIVAAPPSTMQIVVLSMTLVNGVATANTVNLQSTTTTTLTTGNFYLGAAIGSTIQAFAGPAGIF